MNSLIWQLEIAHHSSMLVMLLQRLKEDGSIDRVNRVVWAGENDPNLQI